jgi:L-alanine-DL-glutamate epimerase-like enolase superfamily enzyme
MTSAVVKSVAPWLIGEDPLRTDFLWQTVYARLRDHGQKGVVIAVSFACPMDPVSASTSIATQWRGLR